jgi:transcriptional regulator with GAF, ATPase, and Fis domain
MIVDREREIIHSFISFSDSLVGDFDVLDVAIRLAEDCARLLDVAAVGLLLADANDVLHLLAATTEEARTVEAFQLQREEGPCLDCFHTGDAVSVPDLAAAADRWPRFVSTAQEQGFASVHALPMKLRKQPLGALGLFGTGSGDLDSEDRNLAQALAHVASIAILQESHTVSKSTLMPALQAAIMSRKALEVAKGIVADAQEVDIDEAFTRLRGYAQHQQQPLSQTVRTLATVEPGERRVLLAEMAKQYQR